MSNLFPFQYDSSLSFYIVVYALTLVLHVFFMTYVLAGSCYLAFVAVFPGGQSIPRPKRPLAKILREWMPFVLSAAITAGVAPLLFVQIIYRQEFYTANLLLGWRWLVVIPVLVVAFYLLYVMKSRLISSLGFATRCGLAVGIAGSFLFVAFCWTTNHLLQIDASQWPEIYRSGKVVPAIVPLACRLTTWVCGAFPVMSILAGWQLRYYRRQPHWDPQECDRDHRNLMRISLVGLVAASGFAFAYFLTLDNAVRDQLTGGEGLGWLVLLAFGAGIQIVIGVLNWSSSSVKASIQVLLSSGSLLMLLGMAFLREIVRVAGVDVDAITESTQAAVKVGGFSAFLVFTVMNVALMTFCIRLARRESVPAASPGLEFDRGS